MQLCGSGVSVPEKLRVNSAPRQCPFAKDARWLYVPSTWLFLLFPPNTLKRPFSKLPPSERTALFPFFVNSVGSASAGETLIGFGASAPCMWPSVLVEAAAAEAEASSLGEGWTCVMKFGEAGAVTVRGKHQRSVSGCCAARATGFVNSILRNRISKPKFHILQLQHEPHS